MSKRPRVLKPNRIELVTDIETCLGAYSVPARSSSYSELFCVFISTHPDQCMYRDCTGQYGGKVRINGDVRTTLLREKTSLSKLPGRTKSRSAVVL